MMDITPLTAKGAHLVQAYGSGKLTISGEEHAGAVCVHVSGVMEWAVEALNSSAKNAEAMRRLCEQAQEWQAEILLLGLGAGHPFIPPSIRAIGKEYGLSIDAMDTGAACRTYNILVGEGRRVTAALLAV